MSDNKNTNPQPPKPQQQPVPTVKLAPQTSPKDTSNWDNRPLTTPSNRTVIGNDPLVRKSTAPKF